jgi:hypothetical protein
MRFRLAALRSLGVLVLALAAVLPQLSGVANAAGAPTFYLSLHAGQCAIYSSTSGEHPLVVPCSNPQHNMEVYVVTHGGWGSTVRANSIVSKDARRICLSDFHRLFRGAMRANFGYLFYFPDPGAQTQQYGDRLICGLTSWPNDHAALGAGTHFHAAAK